MTTAKPSLQVQRRIAGRPAEVYRAWVTPEVARKWYFPEDMTLVDASMDARAGGSYRASMKGGDGTVHTAYGTYRELVPEQKLVFTHQWESEKPVETVVTVEFRERDGQTEVTLTQSGLPSAEEARGHEQGWNSALRNLAKQFPERKRDDRPGAPEPAGARH